MLGKHFNEISQTLGCEHDEKHNKHDREGQKVSHYKLSFKGNKINVSIKYVSGRRLRRMIMSYILHLIAFTPPMPYMNYTQIDLHHIITGKRIKKGDDDDRKAERDNA